MGIGEDRAHRFFDLVVGHFHDQLQFLAQKFEPKLVPARPAQDQPPAGGDVASAVARDAVTAAPTARTQPASHLSGFARA